MPRSSASSPMPVTAATTRRKATVQDLRRPSEAPRATGHQAPDAARSAIEPVIGHVKNNMGHNYLAHNPRWCDQRHPGRSRLQLLPPAQVAESVFVRLITAFLNRPKQLAA
ncbi:hypothetical protein ABID25_006632 [Mesorhizobium abyssinicae]